MLALLPITLCPTAGYLPSDATEIDRRFSDWRMISQPSAIDVKWVLSITLFSSLEPNPSTPILEISQLASQVPNAQSD